MGKIKLTSLRMIFCLAVCALWIAPPSGLAAEAPAIRLLLNRAQSQAQSGHLDIAIAAWKQVLGADPDNVEALEGLATASAQSAHPAEATAYIEHLRSLGVSPAVLSKMQTIAPAISNDALLREASRLTQQDKYADAVAIYRKLYGNHPPVGEIALTYYDTLAALPLERKHAIEELRQLAQQFPGNERYSITLGRVLTYDAPTRAEGIAMLQKHPGSQQAQEALHQATVWNETGQRALVAAPTSTEPVAAPPSEVATGYRLLNAGNLASAESHFQSSLVHESAKKDAYAGLGYVHMKQQNFQAAVRDFESAQQNGNRDPKITTALDTSRFWTLMASAGQSAQNNQLDDALSAYRRALVLKPGNIDALNGLGGTLLRTEQPTEAIPYLTQATRADGNSQQATNAWRTLFLAQSQASLQAEAIQTAEHVPVELRSHLEQDPEFLGALSTDYMATGNQQQSEKLLRQALAPFQGDNLNLTTAQRLQYASLLVNARHYNTAVLNYQRVIADSPENVDAWRGIINAEHQSGRDAEALAAFRQLPPAVSSITGKNAGFLALMASIYQSQQQFEEARAALTRAQQITPSTNLRLQLGSLEMASGDHASALRIYSQLVDEKPDNPSIWLGLLAALHAAGQDREALRRIYTIPEEIDSTLEQNPEFLQTLASIYSSVGDRRRAMTVLARLDSLYADRGEATPAAVLLQEGWFALQTGDNERLTRLVQALTGSSDLTADQQKQLGQLWANWAIQRSTALVRAGNSTAAATVLAAALRAFPNSIEVNNGLAGAYLQNGNAKQAVLLYARQDMTKAEEPICLAAINAALAANDRTQAEAWLTDALNRFERDPKVLELAARFEQQRGDRRKAAAYYRAALQAVGPPSVDDLLGVAPTAHAEQTQDSAREDLLKMLAPSSARSSIAAANTTESLWPVTPSSRPVISAARPPSPQQDESAEEIPPPPSLFEASRQQTLPAKRTRTQTDSLPLPPIPNNPVSPSNASSSIAKLTPLSSPPARPVPFQNPLPLPSSSPSESLQSAIVEPSPLPSVQPKVQSLLATAEPTSPLALDEIPASQLAPLPTLTGKSSTPPPPPSPTQQMQQNLEAIESSTSSSLAGDTSVGFHSGQPGFDRLTIFGANIEQSIGIGMGSRLSIITRPVLLESQQTQANTTFQLGSLPPGALSNAQNSAGVGGEVQLRTRSFGAALGYSPYGFLVSNVTGRLLIQPDAGPITATFERQPIEDSQLSYAGLRDPGSIGPTYAGNVWGGIIANTGSLQISRGGGTSGWYAQMGGQYITGRHVQKNFRIDGDAGAYWSVWQQPQYGKLTLGMNFFGMHYDNNQRQFTYGNGGYFSPSAYLLSSIPVTFEGVDGPRLHYRLIGSLGLQAFQEGSSPFFPLDPALQNSALGGYFTQHSDIGANYNIEGETSYLINEHWHVNGSFSLNNTRGYNNDRVGFSLRYTFHPQPLGLMNGPTGIGGSTALHPPVLP